MARRVSAAAFAKTLEAYAARFRRDIEARVSGFDPDPSARRARVVRARDDFLFFARAYFPHHIRDWERVAPSSFQVWLAEELPLIVEAGDGVHLAVAAPRGEAKSTYMLIFAIWCVVFKLKRYLIYVMDTHEQAAVTVEGFKAELEANPRLKMDFPKVAGPGGVWREGEAVARNDVKFHGRGAGQKVRGLKHGAFRPDAVFLDDIENDEHVRSPAQRDKLETWLNKAVGNLGEAGAKLDVFFIGTVLHFDSVLARALRKPLWRSRTFRSIVRWPERMDLWDRWEEILRNAGPESADAFYGGNAEAMERGAEVSWPDKRSLSHLMRLRVRIGVKAFNSEQQNNPADENAAFAKIVYRARTPDAGLPTFGACDPSLGKHGRRGDPSAILIGAFDRAEGTMDVLVASIRRRTPKTIIEEIISLQRQYGCAIWFFESVQFQEFMREQLIAAGCRAGVNIPAAPIIPKNDKDLRIESLSIPIADGRIRLHASQGVLIDQLRQWPNADHDDGPDCLEMLWDGAIGRGRGGNVLGAGDRIFGAEGLADRLETGGVLNGMEGY